MQLCHLDTEFKSKLASPEDHTLFGVISRIRRKAVFLFTEETLSLAMDYMLYAKAEGFDVCLKRSTVSELNEFVDNLPNRNVEYFIDQCFSEYLTDLETAI